MVTVMSVEYFAYGSNIAEDVMAGISPRHRCLGVASLPGFRMAFTRRSVRTGTGVADVVPDAESTVWGVLYEIDDGDIAALDRKEGNGWAYVRQPVVVRLGADDVEHQAVTYVVAKKEPSEVPPDPEYLGGIISAARQRGLPDEYVAQMTSRRASLAS